MDLATGLIEQERATGLIEQERETVLTEQLEDAFSVGIELEDTTQAVDENFAQREVWRIFELDLVRVLAPDEMTFARFERTAERWA